MRIARKPVLHYRQYIVALLSICVVCFCLCPEFSFSQDTRLWATYYGGTGDEFGWSVATDAAGNVYLAGNTESSNGIATVNGFQNTYHGNTDAFLVKFDAAGNRLWGTYYGGTSTDYGTSVAVDKAGNVYLAGWTGSTSNIASGGFQNTLAGTQDAFLVKFDVAGNRLWATYYGGTDVEDETNVTTDASGNVYLSGYTASNSGISSNGFQNIFGGVNDAYLVKFDSSGNRQWATYYGGALDDKAMAVACDGSKDVYLAGYTSSTSSISSGGFQNTFGGGSKDAFLAKFDSSGNQLWASYYGGNGDDWGFNIATDASENVYLAPGETTSASGISAGGFQNTLSGYMDAMLVKFDAGGNRVWATYYGGTGTEEENSVATDAAGNVFLAGHTSSTSNIASGGFQNSYGGGFHDAYLVKFNATTGIRSCATYFGGAGDEYDYNVTADISGNIYLAGRTKSASGIASGGFQNSLSDGFDAYLAKFTSCNNGLIAHATSANVLCNGQCNGTGTIVVTTGTGPYTYKWSNGQSTVTATGLCAGPYTITVADASSATTLVSLNISEPDILAATSSTTNSTCGADNGTATVNATGGTTPYSYLWNTTPVQTVQTATGLSSGNYTATVTDAGNCATVSPAIVNNSGGSIVASLTISASATHICAGTLVTFTASPINGGLAPSYQWKVNNMDAGTNNDSYSADTFNNSDSISCIMISNANCVSGQPIRSNNVILKVDATAKAGTIESTRDSICFGTPVRLTLSGTNGLLQWQSSPGSGAFTSISGATNNSYSSAISETTNFRVVAVNGLCADTSGAFRLAVLPAPTATFTYGLSGRKATFNSDGSTDATTYSWNFGDSSAINNEMNPVHTFAPGKDTFYVCLTVYNRSNCSFTYCSYTPVNVTGIETVPLQNNFNVYPNPFSDRLFISGKQNVKIEDIDIYDMLGRKIVLREVDAEQAFPLKINVSGLAEGMYYLRIKTGELNYLQPLIKQ